MADEYRIDSHKLMFHPQRVADWLSGKTIYPVYMELSPSGACNHRCTFCALDFMEYQARYLDADMLKERLTEMGRLGVKSIMYAGEGEPFLHKRMAEITVHTKMSGIDVAFTTNGAVMNKKISEQILPVTSWIKVSLNAGTAETYAKIHRTKETDFDRVFANLSDAVELKTKTGARCTIGAQMILLPENAHETEILAEKCKGAGLDYLVIKPYSQHLKSITKQYEGVDYGVFSELREKISRFNGDGFSVVFREETMKKLKKEIRGYQKCLALPFWAYIDSTGNVWGCSAHLSDDRFRLGNVYDSTFEQIWTGERRKKMMEFVLNELDTTDCRVNCRMDSINLYLWELTHPGEHVNFI